MLSFRATLLVFTCVVLSLADGVIKVDQPFNTTIGPLNLHDTASLTVTSTELPVSVCIVSSAYGLPHWTQYNEDNCIFFFNSTDKSTPITAALPLRDISYKVGVYFADEKAVKKGQNTTVTVVAPGAVCDAGQFWDGANCVAAIAITDFNSTTASVNFNAGQTLFWSFNNPSHVGSFKLSLVDSDELSLRADDFVMWARFNAVPSTTYNDAIDTNGTLSFASPRPGTWVFGVHAAAAGSAQFHLYGEVCGANKAGQGCAIEVPDITNDAAVVVKNVPLYWKVDAKPSYPFLVSITTVDGHNLPNFFASKGTIPTGKENTDVPNCNGAYCSTVRTITFNVTADETWYVGVFNPHETGNITFGIWWNSTCVVGCTTDNHGECQADGSCSCEIDFEGISCAVSKGLGPQYIVLIIIASLVVASAIIGFVAWAYMRRKRANYEIVS